MRWTVFVQSVSNGQGLVKLQDAAPIFTVVVLGIDSILSHSKLPRLNNDSHVMMHQDSRSLNTLRRPEHAAGNTQTEKGSVHQTTEGSDGLA